MANQITVNSGTGNITVTTSRAVIGTVANVASANYANFAGEAFDVSGGNVTGAVANATFATTAGTANTANTANTATSATTAGTVTTNAQPNITSVGNLTNLTVTNTTTTGNLVVLGNLQVGNLVANSANYANFAGNAFAVAGANVSGTVANATFATTAGSANTANSATVANSANAVAGANVSGAVANATYADNAGNANFANSATVAASANSVTLANVSGAGNIASINLDGSSSNVLYGNGTFAPAAGGNTANANYANFAGNAFSVDGGNVVGAVANATFALDAGNANIANIAYSVDAANVSGLGNIATINLDGNASNFLDGTGNFVAAPGGANANYANFAGQAIDATQSNIKQTGNLVSLTINNNVANTVTNIYDPNLIAVPTLSTFPNAVSIIDNPGITGALNTPAVNYIVKGRPGNAAANNGDIITRTIYGAKGTGGNILFAGDTFNTIRSAPNVANAYVAGQVTWRVPSTNSNLANPNTATLGQIAFTQAGTFSLNAGAPGSSGMSVLTFGTQNAMIGNASAATAFTVTRRRGNNDTTTTVEPNDYLGDFVWQGVTATATGTQPARIRARIDSGYTAGSNLMPIGFEIQTIGNANNSSTHFLYANGNVQFNNAVTANIMTANYLYGDGSNITNVTANIANIAYSVDAANVVGLGNIATINLDGNASNFLDGTGNFVAAPGGNVTPAGSNTEIQYNDGGNLGASNAFTFNTSGNSLTLGTSTQIQLNSDIRQIALNGIGEQPPGNGVYSQISVNNGTVQVSQDNIGGGLGSFTFNQWENTTSFLNPYAFYRARGNASSPQPVANGDAVMTQSFNVYGDSGNTYVQIGTIGAQVGTNDGAGNVSGVIIVGTPNNDDGSTVQLYSDFINLDGNTEVNINAANIILDGNVTTPYDINVNNGNVIIGANGNVSANIVTANYLYGDGSNISNIASANVLKTFGQVFSNASQNTAGANTATYVTFNNTGEANGVSIQSNSNITISTAGTYNLQFSIQATNPDNQDSTFEVWFDKNGNAIADSATQLVLQKDLQQVMTVNILANAAANDYFRIGFAATEANTYIMAVPTANTVANIASVPSAIFTVTGV
jgi:hypothetical protein